MQEERQEERQAKMRETWEVKRHGIGGGGDKKGQREIHEGVGEIERQTETETHTGGRDRKTQRWGKAEVITQRKRDPRVRQGKQRERESAGERETETKQWNKYLE